jgi:hypothetical protein
MQLSLKDINARIQREHPEIELVRGQGYHYLVFEKFDGAQLVAYETRSIMVPYTSQQSAQRWLDDARTFAADMGL